MFISRMCGLAAYLLISCSEPSRESQAAEAAKGYYEQLIAGHDKLYVDGIYGSDTIREDYCSQLCDNARQFIATQKAERGGIINVRSIRAVADSSTHSAATSSSMPQ